MALLTALIYSANTIFIHLYTTMEVLLKSKILPIEQYPRYRVLKYFYLRLKNISLVERTRSFI